METYAALVEQLLSIPALAQYVSTCPDDILNLVTLDWKQRLENYALYQDFVHNSALLFREPTVSYNKIFTVQKLKETVDPLRVLVAVKCQIPRAYGDAKEETTFPILLQESVVLKTLTEAMTKDMDSKLKMDDSLKVFISPCHYLSCTYCMAAMKRMNDMKQKIPSKNQPCILNTRVFDGETICNRFGSQLKGIFQNQFVAIVECTLNSRFVFENKNDAGIKTVRVGGQATKLLAMRETALNPRETLVLGNMSSLCEEETENAVDDFFGESSHTKRPYEDEYVEAIPDSGHKKTRSESFEVDFMQSSQALI